MKKKIVITHSSILTDRWNKYYCLDILSQKFDIEYWDCSAFTYPSFGGKEISCRDYLRKIDNIEDFKVHVRRLPAKTLIVNDMHFTKQNYSAHLELSRKFKDIVYIHFFANAQTSSSLDFQEHKLTLSDRVHQLIFNVTSHCDLLLWLKCKIKGYNKEQRDALDSAKYYIRTKSRYNIHFIDTDQRAERTINLPDYEETRLCVNEPRLVDGKYIVYVGQFLPFHPEIISKNPKLDVESIAPDFFSSINRFFDDVERTTSCKVVIAEHPVSHFEYNPYGGRKIFVGKTAKLVCDAEAVFIHGSGSIDYSMWYNKPTVLLHNRYVREMRNIWIPEQNIAKAIGFPYADTDKPFIMDCVKRPVDPEIRNTYLKVHGANMDDPFVPNAVLLEQHFNELFNEIYGIV